MLNKTAFTLLLLTLFQPLYAAEKEPDPEIFLLDLSLENSEPVNISVHPGYDNQPSFSGDGKRLYFTRSDNEQTDIWYFDFSLSQLIRLTNTPESEYSPKPAPHKNSISVVRVEMNGAQHFSLLNLETGDFKVLAPELDRVGYYSWFSGGSAALFLLPEPFELRLYASYDEQLEVAKNIGRALLRNPLNGELLFVDKTNEPWKIIAFSPPDNKSEVAQLFLDQEDFTISSSGTLWTATGGKLYQRTAEDERWRLHSDLRSYGIENISRLAVNPDETKLAFVNTKK